LVIETAKALETVELGQKIGRSLKPRDLLALYGNLGAGKTTLIQGIAQGLGVKDYVTSPTFILINEYLGKYPFYHVDLYRLNDRTEIEDLGILEYFEKDGVCVIEWAEKMEELLPANVKRIKLETVDEDRRRIELSWQL
jgi:tRNA threonylcarbamoyladenosine biosynthesis protein TsaE